MFLDLRGKRLVEYSTFYLYESKDTRNQKELQDPAHSAVWPKSLITTSTPTPTSSILRRRRHRHDAHTLTHKAPPLEATPLLLNHIRPLTNPQLALLPITKISDFAVGRRVP
jgi:hypothetical protein